MARQWQSKFVNLMTADFKARDTELEEFRAMKAQDNLPKGVHKVDMMLNYWLETPVLHTR